MNHYQQFLKDRVLIANGNEAGSDFLVLWGELAHALDDLVDETTNAEFKIRTANLFAQVYNHQFFIEHRRELFILVNLINCAYADSEECRASQLPWKKELGDVLRHSGSEMVRAVALICGGYDHLRRFSMQFHESCYYEHHTPDGKPV